MSERKQVGWAIVGTHGLYVDWRLTRADMIAKHVHDKCDARLDEFAVSGKLGGLQDAAWQYCKKQGDRAVKVTITW